jgi:hypothetical protein
MKLVSVATAESPDAPGFVRRTASVAPQSGAAFDIWFEVPKDLAHELSDTGNPWLLALLPHALPTGETVRCDLPVDPELRENVKGLLAVWREWYPQFRTPSIECPVAPAASAVSPPGRSAAFFSGGVDSWFTVLRHAPELADDAIGDVDDLITVHGFDIPLELPHEFERLHATLLSAARDVGRRSVVVRTNLRRRDSLWARGWGWLTHGTGLAATSLMLEKRYRKALIGSTHPYGALIPWGSHPLTDPLLSTRTLTVKHDGAAFNRVEKTTLIARHRVALANLHVCWKNRDASNCGRCPKCLRTLTTLHLLGALDRVNPFPQPFDAALVEQIYIEDRNEHEFLHEVLDLARTKGDLRVERAIVHAMRRSRRWRPIVDLAERMHRVPLAWRVGPAMRRWCTGA